MQRYIKRFCSDMRVACHKITLMGISEWRHDAFPKLSDALRINIENATDLFQQEIDNTAIDPIWKDVLQRVVLHEKMTLSFHYSIGEYPYHIMVTLDTNENDAWICKVPSTWQPTYDATMTT